MPDELQRLVPIGDDVREQHGSPCFAAHISRSVSGSRAMTSQLALGNW